MTNEQLAIVLDSFTVGLQAAREQIQNGLPPECAVESPPLIPPLCSDPFISYPVLEPLDEEIQRLLRYGDELRKDK